MNLSSTKDNLYWYPLTCKCVTTLKILSPFILDQCHSFRLRGIMICVTPHIHSRHCTKRKFNHKYSKQKGSFTHNTEHRKSRHVASFDAFFFIKEQLRAMCPTALSFPGDDNLTVDCLTCLLNGSHSA